MRALSKCGCELREFNILKMDNSKLYEIIRFMQTIQSIRIIDWEGIKIQKDLGDGSYGAVKMVTIPNSSKPIAMKILKLVEYQRILFIEISNQKIFY